MPGIFISYRRSDAQSDARQLARRLGEHFGERRVFRDIEDIPKGARWREVIRETLARYNVVLVLIGESWFNATDEQGRRRLEDPEDTLRAEVATALSGENVVIPVLLGRAQMPAREDLPKELAELLEWNAHRIAEDHYDVDVDALIKAIEAYIPRRRIPAWTAAIPVLILALLAWTFVPGVPKPPWAAAATPTATQTSAPAPTATWTATHTPLPPTPTGASVDASTDVPTHTPVPPTPTDAPTHTPVPPTPTVAPTDVPTPTPSPVPTPGLVRVQAASVDPADIVPGRDRARGYTWVPYVIEASKGCFRESPYAIRAEPTTGGGSPLDNPYEGPVAAYYVPLVRGRYYVYVRGWAEHDYQDALYLSWQAEDKDTPTLLSRLDDGLKFYLSELNWQPGQKGFLGQAPIVVDVQDGTHTFFVRMRKAGLVVKELVLSPKSCDFTNYPCDVEQACGVAP